MRLRDLAERLGCELRGDGAVEIERVAPIETAGPGELTFVANPRYEKHLRGTRAAAVILAADAAECSIPSLRTANPYLAFARAIDEFHRPLPRPAGVHASAVIAPSARIGRDVAIGPCSVIGEDVTIGDGSIVGAHNVIYPEVTIGERFRSHANVTVRERVRIGNDVTLHSGAVIGSDGFGYAVDASGAILKITQAGNVVLEDGVEVGANATIDRATIGSTVIRRQAKIDNLVMIAHGCEVGEGAMLAAQVGLAGSTQVGRYVRMGGQVGAAGHLTVGDGAQVAAQSGISNSVPAGVTVGGSPAIDVSVWRRVMAALPRLPELFRRVRRIEKRLGLGDGDAE